MRECDDWITRYLEMSFNTEPPEIYHKWAAVSCIAACLQRKCIMHQGRLGFYPNLYILLVGPPGRTRKGTAMSPIMEFLDDPILNIKIAAEAVTREQLIRDLAEAQDILITPEGKTIQHCSLTICNSEITVLFGYKNNQLIMDLTDWFDCKRRWTYRTKNAGTDTVNGVWVNILGATTPTLIRSAFPPEAIGGGLSSRIIFIYAAHKRKTVVDTSYTSREIALLEMLKNDLVDIVSMSGEFEQTPGFKKIWKEWYDYNDEHHPFEDEILSGYCDRRPAMILKLSMVMSASRSNDMIVDECDILRAIEFLTEAEIDMPLALSGVGKGDHADVLARMMAEISFNPDCTIGHLAWRFRNDVTKWELDRLLSTLEAMKFCVVVTNTGKIIYNKEFDLV